MSALSPTERVAKLDVDIAALAETSKAATTVLLKAVAGKRSDVVIETLGSPPRREGVGRIWDRTTHTNQNPV